MALFDGNSDDDKTESASAHRREESRKQGHVAVSREALSVILLLITGSALYLSGGNIFDHMKVLLEQSFKFGPINPIDREQFVDLSRSVAKSWIWMFLPIGAASIAAGLIAGVVQVGFYFTTEPLAPKWERLDPIKGFGKLFSSSGFVEALKAIAKVGIVGWVVWIFLKGQAPIATTIFQENIGVSTSITMGLLVKLFLNVVFALAFLAAIDYGFQKFQHEKQMRMSRREAKDEHKLREGDPLIKSRIKSMQRRVASRRMMEEVPKADVVITNPTHFAIALKYDSKTMEAPKVIAKGAGVVALKIKAMAIKNRIPVVENKPLARTLFKEMEIGQHIPRELYRAVVEVFAYVYRLRHAAQVA